MISRKNVLLKLLFVLLVLFCTGLESGSCYAVQDKCVTEISTCPENDSVQANTGRDIFDDDQFSVRFELTHFAGYFSTLQTLAPGSVYSEFTDQSWQPPQL